jgi:hypothetical protein
MPPIHLLFVIPLIGDGGWLCLVVPDIFLMKGNLYIVQKIINQKWRLPPHYTNITYVEEITHMKPFLLLALM